MASLEEAFRTAVRLLQAGRLPQAEAVCRQILAVVPAHADSLHLLGVIAGQQGRIDEAIEHLRRAAAIDDHRAAFHSDLATAYGLAGKIDEAVVCLERSLQLNPNQASAYNNLGLARFEQGKLDEAIACYQRALALSPDHVAAHKNLGKARQAQGKSDEAGACYARALLLAPHDADLHVDLGDVHIEQEQLDAAIDCYQRAVQLDPRCARAHNNLGNIWCRPGRLDDAIACYQRALELDPDHAGAHCNLGAVRQRQGNLPEALECYERALGRDPDHAHSHFNRALAWLLQGDFRRGWPEFEWRWKVDRAQPRPFPQPAWDGGPLEGQTILLYSDQGLGDAIQMIRFAKVLHQRGATVVVECQPSLVRLLAGVEGVDRLVARGEPLPPFDVHAALTSVPGLLQVGLGSIPQHVPYLAAEPAIVARWRGILGGLSGLRVGIAWQGNPHYRWDRFRSIALSHFESLFELPGVSWVSLQKGPGTDQLAVRQSRVALLDVGSRLEDFTDTAAVMTQLDLVIACDTAVAHLAAALGVAVWMAIPLGPDWRWLLGRDDSPWYPTIRLFRQTHVCDWEAVFSRMKEALQQRLETGPTPA